MNCPQCRHDAPAGAKFCPECGTALPAACVRCRHELPPGAKFCPECGYRTSPGQPALAPPRFESPGLYTPRHLAEKIREMRESLEGERKQVTVLFADLKGSTGLLADRDPEDARRLIDPVLERMMEAVHRYEGTVNQVMGDGIMALFGAPLAHEDHAVRACYAALRMQETVKRHAGEVLRTLGVPIHIRVGLNSGEVVVRSIGSDLHMDYTAVGLTTHLAARMEQMAMPGTILITPETLRLVEGYVLARSLGPLPVKGLDMAVEVFEVTGAGTAGSRMRAAVTRGLTRFVGRDDELDRLRQTVDRARAGHGQLVAVVGEPGVGKSRLYWELVHSRHTAGWLVLESFSVSYGRATPFLPVTELLKGYFRIDDRDEPRAIREKITGKLLTLAESLRPLLAAFLALFDVKDDAGEWNALSPTERNRRTLEAVKRLFHHESQVQPLLLVFEDLHWIDTETQALLDILVDSLATVRIALLVNYRPEYRHGWGSKSYYTQIRIDPLAADSADTLLQAMLGESSTLEALRRLLIERTDGNPFFLEESVRTLIEMRVLEGEMGAYRLSTPVEATHVPATVQAVVAARIDRLPTAVKQLLQSAAVIGKDVAVSLLEAVADQPTDDIRRGLTQLQASEFLYETSLFPEIEYTFKHALTLEVAYQSLLRERRRVLHARVLGALEQQFGERAGDKVELLAHHAVRGDVWDRAARYLYHAGEKARGQARYRTGGAFYESAIAALDHLGGAADLGLKLDAYLELWSNRISTGQLEDLHRLAQESEALARRLGAGPRLAQVQVRQAQAMAVTGVISGTLESAIDKALEAARRAEPADLRTRAYAQFVAGVGCRDLGRLADAVREFQAGADLFHGQDPHGEQAGLIFPIHVSLGAWKSEVHAAMGDFDLALTSADAALRMAAEIGHPSSLTIASAWLGYVHVARGHLEAARPVLERGLAIAREHDLPHGIRNNGLYLAWTYALLGDHERALDHLRAAGEAPPGSFDRQWTRYGTVVASAYLAAHQLDDARAAVAAGLQGVEARRASGHRPPLYRLEAETLAPEGAQTRRVARVEEALGLATALGLRPEVGHCQLALGRLHLRAGRPDVARESLVAAIEMYRGMNMSFWLEQAEAESRRLA
jgi:class 3 adenylate cyclase/tetratricopeptide (TPR) repeat protein